MKKELKKNRFFFSPLISAIVILSFITPENVMVLYFCLRIVWPVEAFTSLIHDMGSSWVTGEARFSLIYNALYVLLHCYSKFHTW